jgi:hypothetical protein
MDDATAIHASKKQRVGSNTSKEEGVRNNTKERGKRIPCPIDPSHFIFKHIRVCPAAKQERDVTSQEYYLKDVNRGGFGDLSIGTKDDWDDAQLKKRHHDLALVVLRVFGYLFRQNKDLEQLKKASRNKK